MFVRKATGLVKGWSVFDAFIYSAFAINLMALGFGYAFTGIAVFPEAGLIAAIVLSGLFIIFEVLTYASLIAVMPRAGGDYVWQSRVFGGGIGFVLAATGWWFILWHWVPIYANILNIEVLGPMAAIIGWNSAVDFLGKSDRIAQILVEGALGADRFVRPVGLDLTVVDAAADPPVPATGASEACLEFGQTAFLQVCSRQDTQTL